MEMFLFEFFASIFMFIIVVIVGISICALIASSFHRGPIFFKTIRILLPIVCGIFILGFFGTAERTIYNHYRINILVWLFDFELIGVLVLSVLSYFLIRREQRPHFLIHIAITIVLLITHYSISGVGGYLITGSIIVGAIITVLIFFNNAFKGLAKSFKNLLILTVKNPPFAKNGVFNSIIVPANVEYVPVQQEYNLPAGAYLTESKKEAHKAILWHATVKITQPPADISLESEPTEKTFLKDFFQKKTPFGIKLIGQNKLNWEFFTIAPSETEAKRMANSILSQLKHQYPGLDGKARATPITSKELYQRKILYEIKIPRPPYTNKISIIDKFVSSIHQTSHALELYVLWKKAPPHKRERVRRKIEKLKYEDDYSKRELLEMWGKEPFILKMYLSSSLTSVESEDVEEQILKLEGLVRTFTMDLQNLKKGACFKKARAVKWVDILKCNIYAGKLVTAKAIDFDFPPKMPWTSGPILENENVKIRNISLEDRSHIGLGNYLRRGSLTEDLKFAHRNAFAAGCFVGGVPGSGKTYLLASMVNQFASKMPDVGVLIINVGKEHQDFFYEYDYAIKYGDERLKVPYITFGPHLEKSMQQTASYITASLGMKNVVEQIILTIMQQYMNKHGRLPKSLETFFYAVKKYIEKHPYHEKFQQNLLQAIRNRVIPLIKNEKFRDTILNTHQTPKWFTDWQNGFNIYIDLSACNKYVKQFLAMGIFQMVRALTPEVEAGLLKNIIVIDEAHNLLQKPITRNPDDMDFVAKEQMEKIFSELLKEFRSKGVGFVIADQQPSSLFDCVPEIVSLKIIFRVGHPCNTIFTTNYDEINLLNQLKDRYALVLNGSTAERYIIKSLDFTPPKDQTFEQEIGSAQTETKREPIEKEMKYFLIQRIFENPNYFVLTDTTVDRGKFNMLTKVSKGYAKVGRYKEAYLTLYALYYSLTRQRVEKAVNFFGEKDLDFFAYAYRLVTHMHQIGWNLDLDVYHEFLSASSWHYNFILEKPGIKEAFHTVRRAFHAFYGNVHETLKPLENDHKDDEAVPIE